MLNSNKLIFSIFTFCILGFTIMNAQGDLNTEQVEVIKNFDARLLDAERINVVPQLPSLDTATRRQAYNINERTLNVEYLPPKIRPLAMRRDALAESYEGFIRAGAGFPTSFYFDGSYNVVTEDNLDFGINAFHHSANNDGQIENQSFSYTNAEAAGTYYFEQGFAVNGRLGYTIDNVFFYGYNDINSELDSSLFAFEGEQVKQSFTTFNAAANIFNGERTVADFNYNAGFDLYFLEDDYASRETGFKINMMGTKWFNDKHPLKIELITDFTFFRDSSSQNLHNFFLKPNYTYHGDNFTAKIGANLASSDDEYFFYPDVELSAQVSNNLIGVFVGAEGSLQKNNFQALTDYNPFIISRPRIRNSSYYHYYGGIKGNVQGVTYRAQAGYKQVDDLALFNLTNDFDSIPRFDVIYDTVNIVSISANVTAPLFEGFELTGTLTQNFYSTESQEKAWHLPATSVNVAASYKTLENKLKLTGEFFLENGVPFQTADGQSENLNALFDISAGAEYRVSEKFGVFAQVNNLANNKRQRWRRYPVYGLNVLAGISAKF